MRIYQQAKTRVIWNIDAMDSRFASNLESQEAIEDVGPEVPAGPQAASAQAPVTVEDTRKGGRTSFYKLSWAWAWV